MAKIKYPFQPSVLDSMPEEIAELYRGLELNLLDEICSRLKAAGQLNEVTVDAMRALRSHGISIPEIEKAIQKTAKISEKKLNELLDDVVKRNQKYYTQLIDLAHVTKPDTLVDEAVIAAIKKQCQREFGNITRSMGFLVNDGKTLLKPAQAYQWALDSAVLKVESGAINYNEAIRGAVRELADSGLMATHKNEKNWVPYESGWYNRLDVAVRRAIVTGVNAINQQYREQSMEYLGTNLVEVTAHLGARNIPGPLGFEAHSVWQGKIYHWDKK